MTGIAWSFCRHRRHYNCRPGQDETHTRPAQNQSVDMYIAYSAKLGYPEEVAIANRRVMNKVTERKVLSEHLCARLNSESSGSAFKFWMISGTTALLASGNTFLKIYV